MDARLGPDQRIDGDPKTLRNGISARESDAVDVQREPVRVLAYTIERVVPIELVDAGCLRRTHPVGLQEDHDRAHGLLLCPCGDHERLSLGSDPDDFGEPRGRLLDDLENPLTESPHEFAHQVRADALDQTGGQILFDPFQRARRHRAQLPGLELQAMGSVVDPRAVALDELTRRDRGYRTHDRDEISSITNLDPQDTKAAFLVVKGDALDGAAEVLRTNFGRRPATSNLLQTLVAHVTEHATTY